MPLFWRVFLLNAALLVAAALVLAFSPVRISAPVKELEEAILGLGILLLLAVNYAMLRPTFKPLERLAERMKNVDLLRPGRRLTPSGSSEVVGLVRAFNEMLDRLETERRESGRRALAAQEAERKRIAAELHDEVGQTMTGVLLLLERVADEVAPSQRAAIAEVQDATRQSVEEVRRIAQELRPELLEHLGLVSALKSLATRFTERAGLRLEWDFARDLPRLTADVELAVYRIAQESLTNVVRHAGAGRVWLSLQPGRDSVILRVVDDGRGFNGSAGNDGGGLRGMRERAVLIGAALAIKPALEGGVEVARGPCRNAPRLMPVPLVTRILVADDHEIVRRGLKLVMDREPDLEVVAEAGDGAEAVKGALSDDVDLAILDVSMPRMTGLQAARELSRRRPELRLLILSMYESEQFLFEALKAGASGYVLKSGADRDIVDACRAAMRGETFLYATAVSSLVRDFARGGDAEETFDPLTPREQEIVKLIAEAHSSKTIAKMLTISVKTVERHRANILEKLGMRDRVELTRYAIRRGLVEP